MRKGGPWPPFLELKTEGVSFDRVSRTGSILEGKGHAVNRAFDRNCNSGHRRRGVIDVMAHPQRSVSPRAVQPNRSRHRVVQPLRI